MLFAVHQCVCRGAAVRALSTAGDGCVQYVSLASVAGSGTVGPGPRPDSAGQVLPRGQSLGLHCSHIAVVYTTPIAMLEHDVKA